MRLLEKRPDLHEGARGVAGALQRAGVQRGDRVAATAENSDALVRLFLGCWHLGAIYVPINPGYGAAERDHIIQDCAPKLVVNNPALLPPVPFTQGTVLDDDVALLIYTSGTTGKSKGCMLTYRNVVAATSSLMDAWRMSADDVVVHALPLFHVHGLCVALCGAFLAGARVTLLPRFTPEGVVDALANGGTVFMGVPTMYRRLLDHGVPFSARLLCSGSAPLAVEDFFAIERLTGQRVVERYGMSETLITLTNPIGAEKAGTVGKPIDGVDIQIVDDELWVKGPGVMKGYWNGATAEEWLKTGDAARVDHDGYVTILGRLSTDFVKVGGYKISTKEIEDALREHDLIREVAVIGVPDREWGERVVACVVPKKWAPTLDDLRVDLHSSKQPRGLLILNELPKNAMGKVQKKELQRLALEAKV